ncbi:MAG: pilus assembly protein TadG-related protein [Anaerolineaceae bacterium]
MKKDQWKKREQGQVVLIIALAMIGMIGFAALAIDGGMLYSDRRHAQNAADAAAMAGALTRAKNGNPSAIRSSAFNQAIANGYDNNGTTNWVEIVYPYNGDPNYVQVKIKANTNTNFIHLFYHGAAQNQVQAVGHVNPAGPISNGNALAAINKTACKAIWFTGNGGTDVTGGNVFSNSNADANNCQSGVQGGSGHDFVHGQDINVVGGWNTNGGAGEVQPATPNEHVSQEIFKIVPMPDCNGNSLVDRGSVSVHNNETTEIEPGRYNNISVQGGTLVFKNGLYCIGGTFTTNGGIVKNENPNNGGILLAVTNSGGDIQINGNTEVNIHGYDPTHENFYLKATDGEKYDYAGMLIYMAVGNSNPLTINGGAVSSYTGTIYAPSSACDLGGSGDSVGYQSSQVVCNTVKVSGTAAVDVTYDPQKVFPLPPSVELAH